MYLVCTSGEDMEFPAKVSKKIAYGGISCLGVNLE